ncbi:MAG TPA: hypothetical protein VLJ86_18160 [Ramlibacter sp.]|nr:hypothetical protein [Ramlibacter sp.]
MGAQDQQTGDSELRYAAWMEELQRLAHDDDMAWLLNPGSGIHREAFERGLSPLAEWWALKDMADFRGCGCGGG